MSQSKMDCSATTAADGQLESDAVHPAYKSLLEFVVLVFIPEKAAHTSARYQLQCKRAVTEFGRFYNRPATLDDLTMKDFLRFKKELCSRVSVSVYSVVFKRLLAIWRHAAALGLMPRPKRIKVVVSKRIIAKSYAKSGQSWKPKLARLKPANHKPTAGSLREYFETTYFPQRLVNCSKKYVDTFRNTLLRLELFAERPLCIEDLTDELAEGFFRFLLRRGVNPGYVNDSQKHLFAIWRFAYKNKLCNTVPLLELVFKLVPKPAGSKPTVGSLREYFETTYVPQRLVNCSKTYLNTFRNTLLRLDVFAERPIRLEDLTDELVADFFCWLFERGLTPSGVNGARAHLFAIWRFAHENKLCKTVPLLKELVFKRVPKLAGPKPAVGSLREYFETTYAPQRLITCSKLYLTEYRKTLLRLDVFAERPIRLEDLTDELAAGFFRSLLGRGLKPSSVNGARAQLFAIWRFANENNLCKTQPRVKKLKVKREEPDAWSEAEISNLIRATDTLKDHNCYAGIKAKDYFRALLLFAWYTGLRRGSILAMKVGDVNLTTGWVTAGCDAMKTGKGKKFRIGADAIEALRKIILPNAQLLFPCSNKHRLYSDFDQCLKTAGIPPSRLRGMTKFHKVRRTVATSIAVRNGIGAAASHLGHSSEQITLRYIDPAKLAGNDVTSLLPSLTD